MIKKFFSMLTSLLILLFLIFFNSMLLLNFTFIFKYFMVFSKIPKTVSLPLDAIMFDYNSIISYLRNPFIDNLDFKNFTMSITGKIHFLEVKNIFNLIYIFLFLIFLFIIFLFIKKRAFFKSSLLCLNITTPIFFSSLLLGFIIDFNFMFTLFHKLFFKNNYWIFNEKTDSIITVLPEDFFMIMALLILILLILELISINKFRKKAL